MTDDDLDARLAAMTSPLRVVEDSRETRERQAEDEQKQWYDVLLEMQRRRRRARGERIAAQNADAEARSPYTQHQFDSLECYVFALEDAVEALAGFRACRLDAPPPPLLRGTWRDKATSSAAIDARRFRCSIRAWRSAARDMREWLGMLT